MYVVYSMFFNAQTLILLEVSMSTVEYTSHELDSNSKR